MEIFVGQKIIHLEKVDSTNPYLMREFKNGKVRSGTVLHADIQTHARGQRMKPWHAEPFENLTVSMAADLNEWKIERLISLNHIVAIAVQSFLQKHVENVAIKWPNDVMVNHRKIAGILIENQISSLHRRSVIGLGINVNQKVFNAERATSLYLETERFFNINELLLEFIDAMNGTMHRFQQLGEKSFFEEYNQNLWKRNTSHLFMVNGESKNGIILESNREGQLEVQLEDKIQCFNNGEVKY